LGSQSWRTPQVQNYRADPCLLALDGSPPHYSVATALWSFP
jgi:hypothetical protein